MDERTSVKILDGLEGLAQANRFDFARSPRLCCLFLVRSKEKSFRYVPDKVTCGKPDCWSTFKDLESRYPHPETIQADCEDLACMLAGWFLGKCHAEVFVGLAPGKKISHAVAGLKNKKGEITVIDPCIWYGMPPGPYSAVKWREVK